jgi:hypothetical protein
MMCWNPESAQIDSAAAEDGADASDLDHRIKLSGYKNFRSNDTEFGSALQRQLKPENFHAWQQHAQRFCTSQTAQTDLATALTTFCLSKQGKEQSKLASERLK